MQYWTLSFAVWIGLLAAAWPVAAQVDLSALDREMSGPHSQILVLGTIHLSELPPDFNPAALDGVLERLATFKPDIITIEALSGEECDLALRHPGKYGSDYCKSTADAQAATGLDLPAALAAVDTMLLAWSKRPVATAIKPAERRQLAALFLAANDRASAYVQWLQLPESERRADANLSAALVELLQQTSHKNNENYQIAARLAAKLGLPRVYATDNHTGDNILYTDKKAFGQEIMAAWQAGIAVLEPKELEVKMLAKAADLLPLYRYVNAPAYLQALAEVNVSAALQAKSAAGYPQIWVSGWDIRNLRMVANIAETFRERPGARVLSVVGASHKPWFEHWLGQLQGVAIVEVATVLK